MYLSLAHKPLVDNNHSKTQKIQLHFLGKIPLTLSKVDKQEFYCVQLQELAFAPSLLHLPL